MSFHTPPPPLQGEAVNLIYEGKAPRIVQPEEGATYDKIWKKKEVAQVEHWFELSSNSYCMIIKISLQRWYFSGNFR